VLMLHGTTGSAKSMLTDGFAGALYGPGQALDATKYFIMIPDAIGNRRQQQAVGRSAGGIPGIQLRRHGGRPV
jgi:homoserine acetyltransferase